MSTFGERLKHLRKLKNLKQTDVSKLLNITNRNYQYYEYDQHKPDYDSLLLLADYFDVSLDYLTCRSDIPSINKSIYSNRDRDILENEIEKLFNNLTKDGKEEALKYAEFLLAKQNDQIKNIKFK